MSRTPEEIQQDLDQVQAALDRGPAARELASLMNSKRRLLRERDGDEAQTHGFDWTPTQLAEWHAHVTHDPPAYLMPGTPVARLVLAVARMQRRVGRPVSSMDVRDVSDSADGYFDPKSLNNNRSK